MNDETYRITCKDGHDTDVDIDELADILEFGTCPSKDCDAEIESVDPLEVDVECTVCGWEDPGDWCQAMTWLGGDCPRCLSNTGSSGDIRIVGSHHHAMGVYTSFGRSVSPKDFQTDQRPDYCELVTHYTSKRSFLAIMLAEGIKASVTGFFGLPAVCLTDAPPQFGTEFHKRYGPFGISFRKSDIIKSGGGPVLYISDAGIDAQRKQGRFHPSLMPFVNVLRIPAIAPHHKRTKMVDFLSDREWRFPSDLSFTAVHPVGVILPGKNTFGKFSCDDGKRLLDVAWQYGELIR